MLDAIGLGSVTVKAGFVTREDFLAAVVAPIGNVFWSMTARAFVAAGAFTFSAQR